jgi:adenylate cyclase
VSAATGPVGTWGVEVERKFLVADPTAALAAATSSAAITQAYLNRDPDRTMRVRIASTPGGEVATLTAKGRGEGATRPEFEEAISLRMARGLATLASGPPLTKVRHLVPHEGRIWEVDVFEGALSGLVTAEVELSDASERVALPPWLGREVTGDTRYANANLDALGAPPGTGDGT